MNQVFIAILILVFISVTQSQRSSKHSRVTFQDLNTFNKWTVSNKKKYHNDNEMVYRRQIFLENLNKIQIHNSNSEKSYTVSINEFSDMTDEEFQSSFLNKQIQNSNIEITQSITQTPIHKVESKTVDIIVDWRKKGVVTPVKNQGNCGSCWAFGATALLESSNSITNKRLVLLSEQQIVDCVNSNNGYISNGCSGGFATEVFTYAKQFGVLLQSEYPYTQKQGDCRVKNSTKGYYPKGFKQINNTVKDLKNALQYSPVSVNVDATNWGSYYSGVFNNCSSQVSLNHIVLLVGYDESGNWIIKNSWGTNWGERGYIRLASGNSCGILSWNYIITS